MIKECVICGKEFETKKAKLVCSDECGKRKKLENRVKHRSSKFKGIENEDYIICKWCGLKVARIYGMHIIKYHPGKTLNDYKQELPNSPIYTNKDIKAVTKNCGKHMQTEKYRKMFSGKIKGENNPNSKTRTTSEYRKSLSPYSIEFYKRKYPNLVKNEQEILLQNFIKYQNINKLRPTQLQYWLNKGFNEYEGKEKLKERQTTFTLNKCIDKLGEVDGLNRWKKRQEQWLTNYKKNNFSKISQELFWAIYNLSDKDDDIYFATIKDDTLDDSGKNNEYRLRLKKMVICPDFINLNKRKIIEFDGTYWHKRNIINEKKEKERDNNIINANYQVLHIREDEYRNDKNKTIIKCLEWLK